MSSARLKAEMYWAYSQDESADRRRYPRYAAHMAQIDAAMYCRAFKMLAEQSHCDYTEVLRCAIEEMNARFDGDNILIFRRRNTG